MKKKFILFAICIAVCAVVLAMNVVNGPEAELSGDKYKTFVKTKNKCTKCNGCTGYWGYKHYNGTYEGKCSNSDGWGHTCGHGPEKHGLRKW